MKEQKQKWEQRNAGQRRFGWLNDFHQKTKNAVLERQRQISEKIGLNALNDFHQKTKNAVLERKQHISEKISSVQNKLKF